MCVRPLLLWVHISIPMSEQVRCFKVLSYFCAFVIGNIWNEVHSGERGIVLRLYLMRKAQHKLI